MQGDVGWRLQAKDKAVISANEAALVPEHENVPTSATPPDHVCRCVARLAACVCFSFFLRGAERRGEGVSIERLDGGHCLGCAWMCYNTVVVSPSPPCGCVTRSSPSSSNSQLPSIFIFFLFSPSDQTKSSGRNICSFSETYVALAINTLKSCKCCPHPTRVFFLSFCSGCQRYCVPFQE